mmetsp:Transcript_76911/g.238224  ORF Transcript_76911/g.238224 Transcript_76911/m.238224 type:complete len:520 (-) Transcript_76911:195-1754(-)
MPTAHGDNFQNHLLKLLAQVEQHSLSEVENLRRSLESLHAENARLKDQLSTGQLDQTQGSDRSEVTAVIREAGADNHPAATPPARGSSLLFDDRRSEEPASILETNTREKLRVFRERQTTRASGPQQFYKTSGVLQRVVRAMAFEYGTLLLVVMNALWIAIDMDLNGKPLLDSPVWFQVVEHLFVVVFTAEMIVRFFAFEHLWKVALDKWFIFDLTLVLMMIVETWVVTIYSLIFHTNDHPELGIISALRICRLLRVVRVARLCRVVPELKTMVSGMMVGIRSVLITSTILLAITYTFAILLRQLGASKSWGDAYFSNVPLSIYTLLVSAMLPDNAALMDEMGQETWYCAAIYFGFLLITAITVMNMLIGLLCEDIFRVSHEEKELRIIDAMTEKLLQMLVTIDKDFDGNVSKAEFESMLSDEKAVRILHDTGVDVLGLVGQADFIFGWQENGQLPFERFREEVLQFRSTNYSTLGSITGLRRYLEHGLGDIAAKLVSLELRLPPTSKTDTQDHPSVAV